MGNFGDLIPTITFTNEFEHAFFELLGPGGGEGGLMKEKVSG